MDINISIASDEHIKYAEEICREYEESAKVRGTGIAKRTPEYVIKKMKSGLNFFLILDTTISNF